MTNSNSMRVATSGHSLITEASDATPGAPINFVRPA